MGFGRNVPAISATRVLPDSRHRILTALLVPFTSCSARLAVYVMLAATFFPNSAGNVVFAMRNFDLDPVRGRRGPCAEEDVVADHGSRSAAAGYPAYQPPYLRILGIVTWGRLKGFLRTAGSSSPRWRPSGCCSRSPSGQRFVHADVPVSDSGLRRSRADGHARVCVNRLRQLGGGGCARGGFLAKGGHQLLVADLRRRGASSELDAPGALGDAVREDFAQSSGDTPPLRSGRS